MENRLAHAKEESEAFGLHLITCTWRDFQSNWPCVRSCLFCHVRRLCTSTVTSKNKQLSNWNLSELDIVCMHFRGSTLDQARSLQAQPSAHARSRYPPPQSFSINRQRECSKKERNVFHQPFPAVNNSLGTATCRSLVSRKEMPLLCHVASHPLTRFRVVK